MKSRIAAAAVAFAISLLALVMFAVHLGAAITAFSPLDPAHAGPLVPGATKMSIGNLPLLPMLMGGVALVTSFVALWLWRSQRSVEAKTFAVSLLASVNLYFAALGPMSFLRFYFVLPRVMNAG